MSKIERKPPLEVPRELVRLHPEIMSYEWERLSESRWRAPHRNPKFVVCVVMAFGETVSGGVSVEREDEEWPVLFETAARLASQRESCRNGSPIVRPDTENHREFEVVGRCWWCGKWPSEHETQPVASSVVAVTQPATQDQEIN